VARLTAGAAVSMVSAYFGSGSPADVVVRWLFGHGAVAEWLRSGLQSRVHRFESGPRLQTVPE
jgi:hypothetical protein